MTSARAWPSWSWLAPRIQSVTSSRSSSAKSDALAQLPVWTAGLHDHMHRPRQPFQLYLQQPQTSARMWQAQRQLYRWQLGSRPQAAILSVPPVSIAVVLHPARTWVTVGVALAVAVWLTTYYQLTIHNLD